MADGLIASALGGAGEGLAKGANIGGSLYIKGQIDEEHQRLAQEAQSQREERNARLASQLRTAEELAKPRTIAPGYTEKIPGQPDFQAPAAPEKALTTEARNLLVADTAYKNAYARWLDRDKGGIGKTGKPTLPKITPIKDAEGNILGVFDENSGAFGTPTTGAPAKEAITHWFTKDEPAKPAVPPGLSWVNSAREPIEGLHIYYPDMLKRGVGGEVSDSGMPAAAPDPLGLRSTFPRREQAALPPGAPVRTIPAPAPAPTVAPRAPTVHVDVATAQANLANARTALQRYGLLERRRDPEGFATARRALDAAQQQVDQADQEQIQSVGGPAGYPALRVK